MYIMLRSIRWKKKSRIIIETEKNNFLFLCISIILVNIIVHISNNLDCIGFVYNGIKMNVLNASSLLTKECEHCLFNYSNNGTIPDSSNRDLILSMAIGYPFNLYPFIESLRATKCKARVVIFIDSSLFKEIDYKYIESISKCGVQFIDAGSYIPKTYDDMYYYRYLLYESFLKMNEPLIDRVIVVDLYDTLFQHDPFTLSFNKDYLYLSDEGYKIKIARYNVIQINRSLFGVASTLYPSSKLNEIIESVIKKETINGGIQAGGVKQMINFLCLMKQFGNYRTFLAKGDDQGFINIVVHSGVLKRICNYELVSPNSSFMTSIALYSHIRKDPFSMQNETFGYFSRGGYIPAILHQVDRSPAIIGSYLSLCPNINSIPYYMRSNEE